VGNRKDLEEVVAINRTEAYWGARTLSEMPRPAPPSPTEYLPGTEGKIRVMEWRYENGYHIHHPDDAGGPVSRGNGVCGDGPNRVIE
jgi:hypothetical protein